MSEAPNLPAGAQGQGNDPGPAVPHNAHAPATLNALAPLNIPPTVNAPPQAITIIKGPDLAPLTSTIQPLDREKGNWLMWSKQMGRIFSILNTRTYVEGHVKMPDEDEYPESTANWRYNNTFLVMLINNHIVESELIHTTDCETMHGTWESLRKYHHLSNYQVWIDKSCVLDVMKAKESDNIPDFLIKVKKQFETFRLYKSDKYHKMFNDIILKKAIITTLPHSWDTFAANYMKSFLDEEDEDVDPKKQVDSQELLGIISQEYSRRCDKDCRPSKGDRARSSKQRAFLW